MAQTTSRCAFSFSFFCGGVQEARCSGRAQYALHLCRTTRASPRDGTRDGKHQGDGANVIAICGKVAGGIALPACPGPSCHRGERASVSETDSGAQVAGEIALPTCPKHDDPRKMHFRGRVARKLHFPPVLNSMTPEKLHFLPVLNSSTPPPLISS